MELEKILQQLKAAKPALRRKYYVRELAVFGSVARKMDRPDSDVDILVELEQPLGLEFVDLALELERILQHKVDLVSNSGIKPKYFKAIRKDLRYV